MILSLLQMEGYPGQQQQQPTMTCPQRVRHHRHLLLNSTLRTWTFISVLMTTPLHLQTARHHLPVCIVYASDTHLLFLPRHVLLEASHLFIEDFFFAVVHVFILSKLPPSSYYIPISYTILHWVRKEFIYLYKCKQRIINNRVQPSLHVELHVRHS
jgi:hypothetical protein